VPFGGVINELKKRFPMYKSDITDSLRWAFLHSIMDKGNL
jgi:hypothetical protein